MRKRLLAADLFYFEMRHQYKFLTVVRVLKINAIWDNNDNNDDNEHFLCNSIQVGPFSPAIKNKLVAMQESLRNHTQLANMVKSQANLDRFIEFYQLFTGSIRILQKKRYT